MKIIFWVLFILHLIQVLKFLLNNGLKFFNTIFLFHYHFVRILIFQYLMNINNLFQEYRLKFSLLALFLFFFFTLLFFHYIIKCIYFFKQIPLNTLGIFNWLIEEFCLMSSFRTLLKKWWYQRFLFIIVILIYLLVHKLLFIIHFHSWSWLNCAFLLYMIKVLFKFAVQESKVSDFLYYYLRC